MASKGEEEIAALRAELKAEEEANEVLQLRAELAALRQQQAAMAGKTTTTTASPRALKTEEANSPSASEKSQSRPPKKQTALKPTTAVAAALLERGKQQQSSKKKRQRGGATTPTAAPPKNETDNVDDKEALLTPLEDSEESSFKQRKRARDAVANLPVVCAVARRPPGGLNSLEDNAEEPLPEPPEPKDSMWAGLVKATFSKSRKFRAASAKLRRQADVKSWVCADKCGPWCAELPHCYALDCEMCVCEDPETKQKTNRELVRISLVDGSDPRACTRNAEYGNSNDVVLDTLVAPSLPVVDYVTRIHGVSEEMLRGVQFSRRHAQQALKLLACDKCVLVGHAIHNDLEAIQFVHECLVDTSALFCVEPRTSDASPQTPSLKDVAEAVLSNGPKRDLRARQHDSTVDARTALLCADFVRVSGFADFDYVGDDLPYPVKRGGASSSSSSEPSSTAASGSAAAAASGPSSVLVKNASAARAPATTSSSSTSSNKHAQLFVHRIPLDFDQAAVKQAFERTAGVVADGVVAFQQGTPYHKLTLAFRTPQHADLAFDALGDKFDDDKSGRPQKKLFLSPPDATTGKHHGPYCKVRRA